MARSTPLSRHLGLLALLIAPWLMGAADVRVLLASESQQSRLFIRGNQLQALSPSGTQALGGAVTVQADAHGVRLTTASGKSVVMPNVRLRAAQPLLYLRKPDAQADKLIEGELSLRSDKGRLVPIALIPDERYIAGVISGETAPETPWQARLAQAILVRSYWRQQSRRHPAVDADACDQSHCQYYRAPARDKDREAEKQTRNQQLLSAAGTPVPVYYHANCGGHTAPVDIVFGGRPWPHLQGVADPGCAPPKPWQAQLSLNDCRQALHEYGLWGDDPLKTIGVSDRLASGWPITVRLVGQQTKAISAYYWWLAIGNRFGWGLVPSGYFNLTQNGEQVRITGQGIGHGVGLCQVGANRWAQAGRTATWILAHYFPGTKVGQP